MDLTKYYPDIVAKYPAYVTKRELCEICHICPKTAYNLEQQGEIPYTIEQNHLIRSHKIKLTDILAYLYRRECRQEADSPYICAMEPIGGCLNGSPAEQRRGSSLPKTFTVPTTSGCIFRRFGSRTGATRSILM